METTDTLYIKNMVCPRCIKVVGEELHALGLDIKDIQLGKVELKIPTPNTTLTSINDALVKNGFELLDNKKSRVIEQIKILILKSIRDPEFSERNLNLSEYISEHLDMEYSYLSHLFSLTEGKTIERFFILQKIERIKELISYDEFSVKEIAGQLGYSSLQALSSQFKKETGLTPTEFKILMENNRKPLDEI